ncbi:hypothetical protein Tco_0505403 [Tanacetum coccineum]
MRHHTSLRTNDANISSVKEENWFVVPANARFSGFSGSYYCQNRAPAPSDINVVHVNTTYCQSDLQFLRFPKEFFAGLTYVVISLLINRRLIRFEYENGEEMDLNAFIRTADPHKRLLASVDEEFARDASVGCWVGEQGFDSILVVRDYVEPSSACTKYADPEVDSLSGLLLRFDMRLPMLLTISSTVFLQGGHGSSGSCCRGAFCARKEGYRCLARWKSLFLSGTVTRGFELNDGCLCANMIDHFTPSAFFKTVRGMEHEQLFTKFNVSAARNLSLSSEAKEESAVVAQLRAQVSGLEAVENSLRGEVASTKDHNVLLEQECNSLKLKGTGLESTIALKDIFWTPQGLRLAKIDADFTGFVVCAFKESFHPHLLKSFVAGRKMRKECTVGSSAGMSMGNVAVVLTDLEAYIPSAEDDFNSAIRDLRDLNFPLLQELSDKKDASTWDIMDLLQDYDNPDLANVVPENATLGSEGGERIDASARGDLTFSQLDDEAKDAVLSKLLSNASSFSSMFASAVLNVGIPISAGMTASVCALGIPDMLFIKRPLRLCALSASNIQSSKLWQRRIVIPLMMAKRCDLRFIALAFFLFAGKVSSREGYSLKWGHPGLALVRKQRKVLVIAVTFSKHFDKMSASLQFVSKLKSLKAYVNSIPLDREYHSLLRYPLYDDDPSCEQGPPMPGAALLLLRSCPVLHPLGELGSIALCFFLHVLMTVDNEFLCSSGAEAFEDIRHKDSTFVYFRLGCFFFTITGMGEPYRDNVLLSFSCSFTRYKHSSIIDTFLSAAWALVLLPNVAGKLSVHLKLMFHAICLGTTVISFWGQANISIAALKGGWSSGPDIIAHSTGMILLLFSVSVPPITGNFIIPCVVDGTAFIFRNPGLPMIPLNGDVDLTTMKSIHANVECSSSPTFTKSVICPNGHFISPLNPTSEVVAGHLVSIFPGPVVD